MVTLVPERPRSRNSRSAAVNRPTGFCWSSSVVFRYACPCQVPTANGGKRIAPSAIDRSGSRMRSQSGRTVRPRPSHSGHMPDGSLNEYAVAGPALGVPYLENSTRMTEYTSVIVPTVEREWPPTGRWSTTIAGERSSMASACGRSYLGSRLRMNQVKVSFSCRCDSTAIVSKTTDDFPDPETPVKTVSRPFGIRRVTSRRLFSCAPLTWMY